MDGLSHALFRAVLGDVAQHLTCVLDVHVVVFVVGHSVEDVVVQVVRRVDAALDYLGDVPLAAWATPYGPLRSSHCPFWSDRGQSLCVRGAGVDLTQV